MAFVRAVAQRAVRRLIRRRTEESGFALIEVAIASAVLLTVLTGVGSLFGAELVTVGASGAEQTANGLLTQAMEEVRALPFQLVVDGLSTSDSTIATDSNIKITGTSPNQTYTFVPTNEVIPMSSPSAQAPFNPHISTKSIDGVTFKTAAYPTIDTDETGFYRVTIIVSWTPSHNISSVSAQTLVYSPSGGCLTDTNHPFAAPCQPFFYAQSGVSAGGGFSITGTVAGLTLTSISLDDPAVSSVVQMEQATSVLGSVETSEGILTALGITTDVGGASAATESDNDPGTKAPVSQTQTASNTSGSLTLGSLLSTGLSVTPGVLDSGTSVSTVAASASPACKDLGGTTQLTGAACTNNTVTQSGAAAALSAVLTAISLPLVSLSPSTTASFAADYPTSGGSYCTSTSGDGCVHAAAQRTVGNVLLGGLPALAGLTDPLGWGLGNILAGCPAGNYMVALVGYSDTATAESGINAAAPTTSVGGSGKVCYWNGSAYVATSVTLGSSPSLLSIPTLSVGIPAIAAVTITPTISLGTATTTTSSNSGCASACTASSVITSPITGSLEVKVVVLGATLADVTISIDMGTVQARTSYQAAP